MFPKFEHQHDNPVKFTSTHDLRPNLKHTSPIMCITPFSTLSHGGEKTFHNKRVTLTQVSPTRTKTPKRNLIHAKLELKSFEYLSTYD